MYSTGIGLVIEGIAKYENDKLRGKLSDAAKNERRVKQEELIIEEPEQPQVTEKPKVKEPKENRDLLKGIVTTFSKFFKSENLDKDITE